MTTPKNHDDLRGASHRAETDEAFLLALTRGRKRRKELSQEWSVGSYTANIIKEIDGHECLLREEVTIAYIATREEGE